jgi:hypothetical protein
MKRGAGRFMVRSHDNAARVLLLRACVEHLALRAEAFALLHEVVEFLAAFQDLYIPLVRMDFGTVIILGDVGRTLSIVLCKTTLVSSSSFWIFRILPTFCGSWYWAM